MVRGFRRAHAEPSLLTNTSYYLWLKTSEPSCAGRKQKAAPWSPCTPATAVPDWWRFEASRHQPAKFRFWTFEEQLSQSEGKNSWWETFLKMLSFNSFNNKRSSPLNVRNALSVCQNQNKTKLEKEMKVPKEDRNKELDGWISKCTSESANNK